MPLRDWSESIDIDLAARQPITEKTREVARKAAGRFRGSVRVSMGRFYTDEEFEAKRKRYSADNLP